MDNVIASFENYFIYRLNNTNTGTYYLCVPKGDIENYKMFLGFADKDLSILSKDELITEIKRVNDVISSLNANSIYVLPGIPVTELEQAALENDDRKYNEILSQRIQPITAEIYKMLIEASQGARRMDSVINVIKRNDTDKKFAGWLSMRLGDQYIKEVDLDKLKEEYMKKDEENELGDLNELENESISLGGTPSSFEEPQDTMALEQPQQQFSSGIAPINREDDNIPTQQRQNRLVRRLTKTNSNGSPGFGNIKFILGTLIACLIFGVSIGYLMMQ